MLRRIHLNASRVQPTRDALLDRPQWQEREERGAPSSWMRPRP